MIPDSELAARREYLYASWAVCCLDTHGMQQDVANGQAICFVKRCQEVNDSNRAEQSGFPFAEFDLEAPADDLSSTALFILRGQNVSARLTKSALQLTHQGSCCPWRHEDLAGISFHGSHIAQSQKEHVAAGSPGVSPLVHNNFSGTIMASQSSFCTREDHWTPARMIFVVQQPMQCTPMQ